MILCMVALPILAGASSSSAPISLSGTGVTIQNNVAIPFVPARIRLDSSEKAKLTLTNNGKNQTYSENSHAVKLLDEPGTFDVLLETPGNWSLAVEPITAGGTLEISGTGPYIGNFFTLAAPTIVTITANPSGARSSYSSFSVKLQYPYRHISGWASDLHASESLSKKTGTFSKDVIVKPQEGRSDYLWNIQCDPGVEWSIRLK
jgi:hypothetical protein